MRILPSSKYFVGRKCVVGPQQWGVPTQEVALKYTRLVLDASKSKCITFQHAEDVANHIINRFQLKSNNVAHHRASRRISTWTVRFAVEVTRGHTRVWPSV